MNQNPIIFTRRIIVASFFVIFVIVLVIVLLALQSQSEKLTLKLPLQNVPFPTETIQYPADWLSELHYPEAFQLVDTSYGTLPDTNTKGFAAKLRFQGTPQAATGALLSFLSKNGWKVAEQYNEDSEILILIQKSENKSGIVIIETDPGNSNKTLVLITIFP